MGDTESDMMNPMRLHPFEDELDDFEYEEEHVDLDVEVSAYDEDDDDEGVLGNEKEYQAYLKKNMRRLNNVMLNFAVGLGKKPEEHRLLFHKAKPGRAMMATIKAETDLLGKLKQSGLQVNEVDKEAFIAASKSIYDEFGKDVTGAKPLIDKAVALGK